MTHGLPIWDTLGLLGSWGWTLVPSVLFLMRPLHDQYLSVNKSVRLQWDVGNKAPLLVVIIIRRSCLKLVNLSGSYTGSCQILAHTLQDYVVSREASLQTRGETHTHTHTHWTVKMQHSEEERHSSNLLEMLWRMPNVKVLLTLEMQVPTRECPQHLLFFCPSICIDCTAFVPIIQTFLSPSHAWSLFFTLPLLSDDNIL